MLTQDEELKEIFWENHQVDEGVKRYKEAMEDKDFSSTDAGNKIMKDCISNLTKKIKKEYVVAERQMINLKGGKATPWHFLIGQVSAEQTAIITMKRCLEYVQTSNKSNMTTTSLANKIGEAVRHQMMFENWKQNSNLIAALEGRPKSFATILIARAKGKVSRSTLSRWRKKFAEYEHIEWGNDGLVLGAKLIKLLVESCPETFTLKTRLIKGKQKRILNLTNEAWESIAKTDDFMQIQRPFYLPTLVEPKDWQYNNEVLTGGYHFLKQPLFTSNFHKHTAADKSAPSPEFLDSINIIQKTGWKINTGMLSVVEMVYGTGGNLGGIPQPCDLDSPMLSKEKYNALTDEKRKAYHKKRHLLLEEQASLRGKHSAFVRKLGLAHKLMEHPIFYFPHFADFRGRLYPMPQELNPQGDHVARCLLQFATGKKLGKEGLYWLKIHIANTYGKDKCTFKERIEWVDDKLVSGDLHETVEDPIRNHLWSKADEPLTFLAAIRDLVAAYELDEPSNYISNLPVAMDGVCNGMQLLSLLGRDNLGAEKTNCRAIDKRYDLYSEVALAVIKTCTNDKNNNAIAKEWYDKLHNNLGLARKTVKRAVMTTPYGVTPRGIQEQLIGDRHCHDMEASRLNASAYMRDCIQIAMQEVNGKAVELMSYFQQISEICSEKNVPMRWHTPVGLKVTQSYYSVNRKRISTVLGEVVIWEEDQNLGMDAQKNKLAASPNVIHSLDAALLQLTVLKLHEQGYKDFSMIHDSYGMHPCDIDNLHKVIRHSAYEIFKSDYLKEFHTYLEEYLKTELPMIPTPGQYELSEILDAPYFFS